MKKLFLISAVLLAISLNAQDLPPVTQQQLENTADAYENENPEDDNLLQELEQYKKHPVNLNTATIEELQSLHFLNDLQIANLIRYRNLLGRLVSIYELQAVPTWDLPTIKKILPYISVGNAVSMKENFVSRFKGDQSFLLRATRVLEKSAGYNASLNNHYLGDRNHVLFRYRYQYKALLYFGMTGDKDAGEQFFKGAQSKGFDFYSLHFFARRIGIIKSIAIGDYTVNLGQGLIQWQSMAFGKSAEVLSVKRQSAVLNPYRSAGEFYFNRGFGITLQKNKFEATVFASYKRISGNLAIDSVERFTSLLTSGYNRNASEIADRNKIGLRSGGGNINYQTPNFKIGLNAVAHHFTIPLEKRDEPYNKYAVSGKDVFNWSIDCSYTYQNIHLFGEAALDKASHKAFINGILLSLDAKADLSLLYRNIQKEYGALLGNAFTESTAPSNEKGIYAGLSIRPVQGWQLNAYADLFQFPWIRYRVNVPTRGYDYLVQLNYRPNKQLEIYARYRNKNKPIDRSGNSVINYPEEDIRQGLRIHFTEQLSKSVSINSRAELLWYGQGTKKEEGFLGYIQVSLDRERFSSDLRLQYFESGSYNSRIYAYESDVLYSYSIPAFYDAGFRYYLNLSYGLTTKFKFWMRWSQTIYQNKETTGSGLDEMSGNSRTEIKAQLQYLF